MKSPDQELTEVLWARCVGPEGSIDGLEDGQGRRLEAGGGSGPVDSGLWSGARVASCVRARVWACVADQKVRLGICRLDLASGAVQRGTIGGGIQFIEYSVAGARLF